MEFSGKDIEFIDLRQITLFYFIPTGRKELDIGLDIGLFPGSFTIELFGHATHVLSVNSRKRRMR